MTPRAKRLARGWVVGVLATALAAASHAIAGGGTPSPLALGVGVVFGGMLSTFALSRRPSLPRLAISVGVTQLAFHAVFSMLGTAGAMPSGHRHDGAPLVLVAEPHAHADTPEMWLAHAVAGLLTLTLLRGAERALWHLLTELARLVITPFRRSVAVPVALARRRPLVSALPAPLVGRHPVSSLSRRGPPVPVAF
jgi:hypothetical protein